MKEKVRFLFVDLLRGWALLVMIEVHVFNVTLLPSLKETSWFHALNFINGLVAPSFLFISGFAFVLSTRGNAAEMRKFNMPFWKKMGRIALIFLAGYSLHLPILSLRRLVHYYSPDVILRFYNVDILQCIGAGLLILFLIRLFIESDKVYNYALSGLLILTVFLSPLVWQIDFGKFMPLPLAAYFNDMYGSYFPLFPWLGFLLAGAVASRLFILARENSDEKKYINSVIIIGLVFAALGHFFLSEIFNFSFRAVKPHPIFFMERLGYVMALLGACWYYIELRKTKSTFVLDVGRESLLVYWLHLQIIYRHFWNDQSLASVFGDRFVLWQASAGVILLAAVMVFVAKYWGGFKRKHKSSASNITLGIVLTSIIIFLIGF